VGVRACVASIARGFFRRRCGRGGRKNSCWCRAKQGLTAPRERKKRDVRLSLSLARSRCVAVSDWEQKPLLCVLVAACCLAKRGGVLVGRRSVAWPPRGQPATNRGAKGLAEKRGSEKWVEAAALLSARRKEAPVARRARRRGSGLFRATSCTAIVRSPCVNRDASD